MSIHPLSRPTLLALAMAHLAIVPALSLPAHAAEPATATAPRNYHIPAGPLDETLGRFGRESGVVLSFSPDLVAGLQSPGLQGGHDTVSGLALLLQGTGLAAEQRSDNTYALQKAPSVATAGSGSSEVTLATVKVAAQSVKDGNTEGSNSFTTRTMASATHLPLTIRETPQSVTVLTSARLEADNINDLVDIAKSTPGLRLDSSGVRPVLFSRGQPIESVTQDGIATLYRGGDGDSLGNLAMQDRVEVVRGATGLMQGAGNPSAAVNMIRKRPTSTPQFKGSVSAGSWDNYQLMADVSGPVTEDGRVRARVVGFVQDAGDYHDLAFDNKRLGYATVDIDLTDRTTFNIGYSHLYSNKNKSWGGLPTTYAYGHLAVPRSTFAGMDWEYNKNEVDSLYANLTHDFGGGWNLGFNGTYVDGRSEMLATWLVPTPDVGGHGHVWYANELARVQKAADIKVSGPVTWFGKKHDLVFGGTLNRQKSGVSEWPQDWFAPITSGVDLTNWNHAAPRPDTSTPVTSYTAYYKQDSLYTAGRFRVAEPLDLLLGARLDWFRRNDTAGSAPYSANAHLTNYAALSWKFEKRHSAYVSYTDVFQPQNERDLSGNTLSPKTGKNYELGVKGEYFGGSLNGSVAIFRVDENNRAAYLIDQSGCNLPEGCYTAAGLVRTEGVDIELQGAITRSWQIGAGLTWSETRYREDLDPANIGKRFNTADPKTQFKLSTQYTLPGELSGLTLGGRIDWQSKMFQDGVNANSEAVRNQQNARAIVDLTASYRLTENLHLKLDINNVFDKVYYTSIGNDWYWGAAESFGRPRNAQLMLSAAY